MATIIKKSLAKLPVPSRVKVRGRTYTWLGNYPGDLSLARRKAKAEEAQGHSVVIVNFGKVGGRSNFYALYFKPYGRVFARRK